MTVITTMDVLQSTVCASVCDDEQLDSEAARSLWKAWDQTAEAGQRRQSGRHESLLLQCTEARPITQSESSTCVIKCFALKVKSISTADTKMGTFT